MAKTATPVRFTSDEYDQIAEFLRVASQSLREESARLSAKWPSTTFTEKLLQWSEQATDLRERIETRNE